MNTTGPEDARSPHLVGFVDTEGPAPSVDDSGLPPYSSPESYVAPLPPAYREATPVASSGV